MNTQKINFQERIQQKNGLVGDCSIKFGNHSSDYFGIQQQPWNMRIRMQPPSLEAGGGSQHQILGPVRSSSSTILSGFESPASAFYATERYMGFPDQYDCQVVNPSPCSQFSRDCDSEFPTYQFSRENFPVISTEPSIELRNSTLQSIPKSDFCSNNNQYYTSSENSYRNPPSNRPFLPEQVKLLSGPFEENQDHRVGNSSYGSMNYGSQQEKQSPRFSLGGVSSACSVSSGAVLSSKTRIRWTQDLHEKFVECVNRLGGAEKATPKAILKLMESDGLTIFHVKSHLQKYRMAKYIPDSAEGKSETRNTSLNDLPQLDAKTGLQIKEALQLQLDVQMRLHEQLEIQRNLQLRIEEQGRQLKMLFDQQQRTNSSSQVNDQSSDSITHQDEPTFSLEDIEDSIAKNSGNTHFPSKISDKFGIIDLSESEQDTLQPHLSSRDCNASFKFDEISCSNFHGSGHVLQDQNKQLKNKFTCACASTAPTPILSGNKRVKWTQDLHKQFVECVNRLGGAEKATPKAVLKLMKSNEWTIYHVKSHLQLQKY